ncbi:hypothetical protein HRbin24_01768 [bacterium HR24]|nr:hypothetical protein HRbin24_01768 [bacterium HR24]
MLRHGPYGPAVEDDEDGDDGSARPGGELVQVDGEPGGQEHELRRQHGYPAPVPQAQHGQPDLGEDSHPRHAAPGEDERARLFQQRVVGGRACHLEGQVGLDGGIEVGRAAIVNGPGAVRPRLPSQIVGHLAPPFRVGHAQDMGQHQVLGRHGDVALQFTPPITLRVLGAQEIVLRAAYRIADGFGQDLAVVVQRPSAHGILPAHVRKKARAKRDRAAPALPRFTAHKRPPGTASGRRAMAAASRRTRTD